MGIAKTSHCTNYLIARFTTLCLAQQNLSNGVNVVSEGAPSLIFKVLLISLGITILPRSSTRLTIPVAFIFSNLLTFIYFRTIPVAILGALVADGAAASLADRGHSLRSLYLPSGSAPIAPLLLSYIFLLLRYI